MKLSKRIKDAVTVFFAIMVVTAYWAAVYPIANLTVPLPVLLFLGVLLVGMLVLCAKLFTPSCEDEKEENG